MLLSHLRSVIRPEDFYVTIRRMGRQPELGERLGVFVLYGDLLYHSEYLKSIKRKCYHVFFTVLS